MRQAFAFHLDLSAQFFEDDTKFNRVKTAGNTESIGRNPRATFLAPTSVGHTSRTGSFAPSLTETPGFLGSLQRDLKEITRAEERVGVGILDS